MIRHEFYIERVDLPGDITVENHYRSPSQYLAIKGDTPRTIYNQLMTLGNACTKAANKIKLEET